MKKFILAAALVSTTATLLFALLQKISGADAWLSIAVSCGTCAYHFIMRLLVGTAVNGVMRNRANYRARWFISWPFEQKIHRFLRVGKWKKWMPSYQPELFSMQKPLNEVIQAMCQAEIVHEIIIPLSFLPLLAVRWFGAFPVFLITSFLAASVDAAFVLMQRYNRPRILKLMQRLQNRQNKKE